jgi:hypothetical protein
MKTSSSDRIVKSRYSLKAPVELHTAVIHTLCCKFIVLFNGTASKKYQHYSNGWLVGSWSLNSLCHNKDTDKICVFKVAKEVYVCSAE